ncbi:Myxococcus cysteine-rich repeat-containing protein [Nannocystis exedens]|uniref:Myxococcus cysteine-rich repeat-containing protein n=1 Tax=Nannocystis exedens TaxID=54 RepID=A0A1I2H0N5_9BACT|nr:myxococcus cysteine-rich repeat containing protein [Nannocystis exedens]PCC67105.1 hypothetical protein NAEX_00108 [Nannocystis exedens]SFF23834.1 Myxococcus cysteine-rich repeat-containing protein [Nannocystis exedens]
MRLLAVARAHARAGLVGLAIAGSLTACFSPEGSGPVTAGTTGTPGSTSTTGAGPTPDPGPTSTSVTPVTSTDTTTSDPVTTAADTTESTDPSITGAVTSTDPATSADPSTTGQPARCGDGVKESDEECDDGNVQDGDGCSATCTSEIPVRYVFLTSATYPVGAFDTLPGADALCNQQASLPTSAPALKGRAFKAWLSSETVDATSRLTPFDGDYRLPDGTVVATGTTAFSTAGLLAAIDVQDNGEKAPSEKSKCIDDPDVGVWTGTFANGLRAAEQTCAGWVDTGGVALYGAYGSSNDKWTDCGVSDCSKLHHLYCIETGV